MIGRVTMNLAFALALCLPLGVMLAVYFWGMRQERRHHSDKRI